MILLAKDKEQLSIFEKHLIRTMLEEDRIIAFPSDTVYGLGVNGLSSKAVHELYSLKGRNEKKPLVLLTDQLHKIEDYLLDKSQLQHPVLQRHWPGALTCVFDMAKHSPLYFSKESSATLGIRIPDYPLLLDLLAFLPFPLVTTSANVSNQPPLQTAEEIEQTFNQQGHDRSLACVIDAGKIMGTASTVIQIIDSSVVVLRKGPVDIHYATIL